MEPQPEKHSTLLQANAMRRSSVQGLEKQLMEKAAMSGQSLAESEQRRQLFASIYAQLDDEAIAQEQLDDEAAAQDEETRLGKKWKALTGAQDGLALSQLTCLERLTTVEMKTLEKTKLLLERALQFHGMEGDNTGCSICLAPMADPVHYLLH